MGEGISDNLCNLPHAPETRKPFKDAANDSCGLWPVASMLFRRFHRRTFLSMLCAVPTVLVVEDLVPPRFSFELHHEDRLHTRSLAGG